MSAPGPDGCGGRLSRPVCSGDGEGVSNVNLGGDLGTTHLDGFVQAGRRHTLPRRRPGVDHVQVAGLGQLHQPRLVPGREGRVHEPSALAGVDVVVLARREPPPQARRRGAPGSGPPGRGASPARRPRTSPAGGCSRFPTGGGRAFPPPTRTGRAAGRAPLAAKKPRHPPAECPITVTSSKSSRYSSARASRASTAAAASSTASRHPPTGGMRRYSTFQVATHPGGQIDRRSVQGVACVVVRPAAPVDQHRRRMGPRSLREAQVAHLVGEGAVADGDRGMRAPVVEVGDGSPIAVDAAPV